ncbi:hypothetical protein [Ferrimonas senticii]|uniref:hypothetical protein n=1 Tax=Ferrimonas senticii TaxID=394566 RepID=UPI0003F4D252|nr:hypothetical protein [Ferrimonas senticii]
MNNKPSLAIAITLVLTACGGGGGSSNEGNAPAPAPVTTAPEPAPAPTSTAELVASPQMDFASCDQLQVLVNAPENSFVAAYYEFEQSGTGFVPNYQQRQLSGLVVDGQFQASLMAPDQQQSILVELWPPGATEPQQRRFELSQGVIRWQVN